MSEWRRWATPRRGATGAGGAHVCEEWVEQELSYGRDGWRGDWFTSRLRYGLGLHAPDAARSCEAVLTVTVSDTWHAVDAPPWRVHLATSPQRQLQAPLQTSRARRVSRLVARGSVRSLTVLCALALRVERAQRTRTCFVSAMQVSCLGPAARFAHEHSLGRQLTHHYQHISLGGAHKAHDLLAGRASSLDARRLNFLQRGYVTL